MNKENARYSQLYCLFVFYLSLTKSTTIIFSDICLPGSSSSTGVAPCNPCALHSYQSNHGRTECIPCPDGKVTITTGSTTESHCIGNVSILVYFQFLFKLSFLINKPF